MILLPSINNNIDWNGRHTTSTTKDLQLHLGVTPWYHQRTTNQEII